MIQDISKKLISAAVTASLIAVPATGFGSLELRVADADPIVADQAEQTDAVQEESKSEAAAPSNAKESTEKDASAQEESNTKAEEADKTGKKKKSKKQSAKKKAEEKKAAKEKKKKEKEEAEKKKQKKIAAAVSYLSKLATDLEQSTEDLQEIKERRQKVKKQVKEAKSNVRSAKVSLDSAQETLERTVKEIYKNGNVSYMSVLLGASNFEDFIGKFYLLESVASNRADAVNNVTALRKAYDEKYAKYEEKLAELTDLEEQAEEKSTTITKSIAAQVNFLNKLDSKVVANINAVDTAKASQKWLAKYAGSKSKEGSHPEIVSIAAQYLGVPYVWGGETPAGFDCSGIVMYCYNKIGISLPHFARSQYDCGTKIAKEALMPGDLVFFGPNVEGIHHVGIYVGKGKYLHAPKTGDVVKVSNLSDRSDYVGACRPS